MPVKLMFWNIENFEGDNASRAQKVVQHIRAADAQILGFSEIKDKAALRSILQNSLTDYDFGITDGAEGIELLAGWKRNVFDQALFTQRREFKADNPHLRPGSLLSVKRGASFLNVLFLHTDSGTKDRDYNNRQDMFEKIWSLKKTLSIIEGGSTRFIVLGDLNTMGRDRRGSQRQITGAEEIADLDRDARMHQMSIVPKSFDKTWARVHSDGKISLSSNLDHVLATDNLTFAAGTPVLVRGWNDAASDQDRFEFVEKISDHCSLDVEILNV